MKQTEAMKERSERAGVKWKDEGNGFFSGVGNTGFCMVAYIKLPEGHPDIDKDYNDLDPEVNGGLTFGIGDIFGWDYGHYENDMNVEEHIENALKYFRSRLNQQEQTLNKER